MEGERTLLFGEELGLGGAAWEIKEGKDGKEESNAALDNEEIAPDEDLAVLDLEDAKGEQAGEGIGNVGRGVEDGQATGELSTTVESGQVVDDGGEEGGFSHSQEPADSENTAKVLSGSRAKGHGAESEHHDGQSARRSEFLGEHSKRGSEDDVGDEEDGDDEVVLVGLEVEIYRDNGDMR